MKKTQKTILGFFGLAIVAVMTIIATVLPGPKTSALSSVVDTVVVTVVGTAPDVGISGIESGVILVEPENSAVATYSNVNHVTVELIHRNVDDTTTTIILTDMDVSEAYGQINYNFNFDDPGYGYGEYIIRVIGRGMDSVTDEDLIQFTYLPFDAGLDEDEEHGKTYVDLDYEDEFEPSPGENYLEKFILEVYDKNGHLISPLSPITALPPEKKVDVPFGDYDLADGTYKIKVTAYDNEGNILYVKYLTKEINNGGGDEGKDIPVPDTNVPDTGRFLKNLNISRVDFLVTGLIMFFMVGVGAIVFISKKGKKNNKRR